VYGGKGAYCQGGAGTVYIVNQKTVPHYRHFITDNGGFTKSNRIYEVERLNLTGNYYSTHDLPEMTFHTHSGINVTTSVAPYSRIQYSYSTYNVYAPTYPLSYLFSDKKANVNTFFMSASQTATLTFNFPFVTYVEYLRIYPYCDTSYSER
jgi:hypothetical protein